MVTVISVATFITAITKHSTNNHRKVKAITMTKRTKDEKVDIRRGHFLHFILGECMMKLTLFLFSSPDPCAGGTRKYYTLHNVSTVLKVLDVETLSLLLKPWVTKFSHPNLTFSCEFGYPYLFCLSVCLSLSLSLSLSLPPNSLFLLSSLFSLFFCLLSRSVFRLSSVSISFM